MVTFTGFTPEIIDFFWELRMNNSKEWMDQNRERYKACVKDPFDAFSAKLAEEFGKISKEELGWSISRINRDIRYSKDKSPYRSCRWVVLKEPLVQGTDWKGRPSFYFELSPEGYVYGMGFYEATPGYTDLYRKKIDSDPNAFGRMVKKIAKEKHFLLHGEEYKRIDGAHLPEDIRPWYGKKSFAVTAEKKLGDEVFHHDFPERIAKEWKRLLPLHEFLKSIKEE